MPNPRSLSLCALAFALLGTIALAQSPAPATRILTKIDANHLVTLKGNIHPLANAANDRGPVDSALAMSDLTLVLSRSAEQQAAFDGFVESQYDSGSPNFHQWLTPAQIGERFGPAQADIDAISGWLSSQGFVVAAVSPDRMTINFNGTAGQVQSAFHAEIHNLSVNGTVHIANMTDPQIPEALSSVVIGVKGLHNFVPHPLHRTGNKVQFGSSGGWQRLQDSPAASLAFGGVRVDAVSPQNHASLQPMFVYTSGSSVVEDITPYDFATIYNVLPLWQKSSPVNGTGQIITVIGTSDINASDVATFKSAFGLPAGLAPIQTVGVNGIDPGVCTSSTNACGIGDLEENTLDVEWSGAVAPGAQVVLVTSGYNNPTKPTNDPIFQSAQWVLSNVATSGTSVFGSHIMSISYGQCELGMGTSSNVAYRNLWQSAAAAGIAVFVASGDSGTPACDQGGDSGGYPYSAQYGLSVNGLASTPFNTAVGGTDFNWCKPSYSSSGNFQGCASSNATAYWNTSNASGTQASAKGYVPETPWNDSCLNPVWATFLESIAPLVGYSTPTSPEAACNFVYNNWKAINAGQVASSGSQFVLAGFIDTVGAGGGASNCVVNDNANASSCTASTTSTGSSYGNLPLVNDGWPKPSWQTGVAGIPADGVRDLPDVSFFSGDGSLNSATLVCLSQVGATCASASLASTALEIGGTSVATPEMAGIMALINQNAGSGQGNPNAPLYQLAGKQTYSSCTSESGTTSNGCYFNDVDQGNITQPCAVSTATLEGGAVYNSTTGVWNVNATTTPALASPNCAALVSGDKVGTLVSSGTTPGYNAATGFDLATGLGSMNVSNVVTAANTWTTVGTTTSTVTVAPASNSIAPDSSLSITVTVAGASGTPTGTITLSSSTYVSSAATLSSGSATITIPANTFTGSTNPFTATITASYSGNATYAQSTGTATVTVTKRTPVVAVTSAVSTTNSNVPISVTVAVTGAGSTPTGTVTLSGGAYTSSATSLASGSATFTIPANTFTSSGVVTLAATYSGDSVYTSGTNSASVTITYIAVIAPTVTVTPAATSINTGQSLNVTVKVTGANGSGTGNVTLASGTYTSAATALVGGSATITIPANSLSAGTATLTGSFPGDANYFSGTGTAAITVTQSSYAFATVTPSPASVTKGGTSTAAITGTTSSTGYTGTVSFASGSCALTTAPTGAVLTPTCSVAGTITYSAGSASGTATATVSTTAASAELVYPRLGNGKGWLGAGGGAILAFLVFFGIPARRRSWRAMLGMVVLLVALGTLSACGGGSSGGSGGTSSPGTTAGSYTFTVTGTGSDPATTKASTTFTITVN